MTLPGPFNVANALGAVATLAVAGVPAVRRSRRGSAALPGVPGRMERVDAGQPYLALVDYAHTPDAVATLLAAVRASVSGPVVVVLGCGGDRDPHKRPADGRGGCRRRRRRRSSPATTRGPRTRSRSSPRCAVGAEQALGCPADAPTWSCEPDRAAAIALAVRRAVPGGAVVVAGKGHETGQEIGGRDPSLRRPGRAPGGAQPS